MQTKKIEFKNNEDITLSGRLDLPVGNKPVAYALLVHCFTCDKSFTALHNISRSLTNNKIAVFRFDFTGLGESSGDFSETAVSSNISDILSAVEYLSEKYEPPQLLIGHSLGGTASLLAAPKIPSVKAVVAIASPYDPIHVESIFKESTEEINNNGQATVQIGKRTFIIKKKFLDDLKEHNMYDAVHYMRKALLLMHSPHDKTVNIENVEQIYKAALHPKSFISLDRADHLITNRDDAMYAGNVIANWASRYLEIPESKDLSTDKDLVVRTGSTFTTEIKAGNHIFLADEPKKLGGNDFGPTPYDLLLSSLGACTGMTLRMYADRKKWDLKEVKIHLKHEKIHASDCGNCENISSKIDHIEREIELTGNLDDEQKQRLLEIADRCPVHKTLHSEIRVNTKLMMNDE